METIWDLPEYKPYSRQWYARQKELDRRKGYYDGSVYKGIKNAFNDLGILTPRLYKGIKTLYLHLFRAVDVDAGLIPGGWAWPEDAPESWDTAREQLFAWSKWMTQGVLYVHYGAQFGLSGIKVADVRELGQVQLLPCSPEYFMLVPTSAYDATPSLAFWLEHREGDDGQTVEYAEVITPDLVRTYWDGKPADIDGRPAEYRNELGFVPYTEVKHKETGDPLGECTYQMAIPLLDEVNELASYLADIIKKHAEPQWAVAGAEASELVKSGDNVWFLPAGAKAEPLVANVDIGGVGEFLDRIDANVKGSLPELAFDELKSKTNIATATLEIQLMELTIKVQRCRPNYDQGLIDALRMAGRAAATMGLGELAVLDDEGLALDEGRPVLPINRLDEIAVEQAELGLEASRRMNSGDGLLMAQQGGFNG